MLPVKKILCPTDFSEPSYQALLLALKMVAQESTEITLLHVLAPDSELPAGGSLINPRQAQFDEAQKNLDNLIRDLKADHVTMRAEVLQGDVTSEILRSAATEKSDLIVMSTRGASGWREFALGSVADEVVRLAPCPVLTIGDTARRWVESESETEAETEAREESESPARPGTTGGEYPDGALHQSEQNGTTNRADSPQVAAASELAAPTSCASPDSDEDAFPMGGSPEAKLRYLLRYAILAPSNRNSQPWLWKVSGNALELYADRARALPHLDPEDRELILSCGASLEHLVVAMRHFGHRAQVEVLLATSDPNSDDPNLVARIYLGEEATATEDDDRLFEGIFRRRTNRKPFEDRALPDALINELRAEAVGDGTRLLVIHNAEKRMTLINLVSKGDRVQGRDALFLQETAGWIHPDDNGYAAGIAKNFPHAETGDSGGASGDGIPQYAFGGGGLLSRYNDDLGEAQADKDRLLAWTAPVLAVLTTEDDRPQDWLAAGRALARILLRAGANGVQASFFNSPVEVETMWPQLHDVLGCAGLPQMIMRLGYPIHDTPATPRRALREVVL